MKMKEKNLAQRIVLVIMILCILPFWPLGMEREFIEQRSGDSGHALSQELMVGDSMAQTFRAAYSHLLTVDFAVDYDREQVLAGNILFELLDKKGNVLYQELIPYNEISAYSYYTIEVNQSLKKYQTYQYRITNVDIESNCPKVVYTAMEEMHAPNNREMTIGQQKIEGQALTRYEWDAPLTYPHVLAIIGCITVIGFFVIALIQEKEGSRSCS